MSKDGDVPLVDADAMGRYGGDPAGRDLGSRALFDWLSPAAPKADGQRLLLRDALAAMPVALLVEEGVREG